jgi:soluble lytic murein transglycosylase-like protein
MIGITLWFLGVTQTTFSHTQSSDSIFFGTMEKHLTEYIMSVNNKVTITDAVQIVKSTMIWSKEFAIDPLLLVAVQQIESRFNKNSMGESGSLGLMQIIPKFHLDKMKNAINYVGNSEPFNINTNIYLGTWILKNCMKRYKNNIRLSLGCYNGNVSDDTYANKVLEKRRSLLSEMFSSD